MQHIKWCWIKVHKLGSYESVWSLMAPLYCTAVAPPLALPGFSTVAHFAVVSGIHQTANNLKPFTCCDFSGKLHETIFIVYTLFGASSLQQLQKK